MFTQKLAICAAAIICIPCVGQDKSAQQRAEKEAAERLKARQTRPDNQALARRLVESCLIRAGDIVLVRGEGPDRELLESTAAAVRAAGAFPILRTESERLNQLVFDEVPESLDALIDPVEAQQAAQITAIISIDGDHTPTMLNHVPASRIAARARNSAMLDQLVHRRGVRRISLGRDLYPAAPTANRYALSVEELDRAFWYACSAQPMSNMAAAVKLQLARGNQVEITGPNGTSLKFRIEKRPVFVNDGAISDAEARAGGAACYAFLPAGEVYTTIVPGTADGKVVCDSLSFRGRIVQNLSITFKSGRVTSINGRNAEPLRKAYDAAGAGKDQLGWLDIGINPDIALPRGTKPLCAMPAGMITLGIGGNLWAGGDNAEAFQLPVYLPGCTMRIDGAPLVKDGTLAPTPVFETLFLID